MMALVCRRPADQRKRHTARASKRKDHDRRRPRHHSPTPPPQRLRPPQTSVVTSIKRPADTTSKKRKSRQPRSASPPSGKRPSRDCGSREAEKVDRAGRCHRSGRRRCRRRRRAPTRSALFAAIAAGATATAASAEAPRAGRRPPRASHPPPQKGERARPPWTAPLLPTVVASGARSAVTESKKNKRPTAVDRTTTVGRKSIARLRQWGDGGG